MTVLQDQILAELDLAELNADAANDRVSVLRQILDLSRQLDGGAGEGADPGAPAPLTPAGQTPASSQPSATVVGALPRAAEEHPAPANGRAGDTSSGRATRAGGNGAEAPGELPEGAPGSGPSPAHQPARKKPAADIGPAILKALDELGQATYQQIAEHAGLILSSVTGRVLTLVDAGHVVCVGVGTRNNGTHGRPPKLYALKTVADDHARDHRDEQLARDVLECVAQGAGIVDRAEIAAQLEVDKDQVTRAVGWLVTDRLVELHEGTYEATAEGHARLAGSSS